MAPVSPPASKRAQEPFSLAHFPPAAPRRDSEPRQGSALGDYRRNSSSAVSVHGASLGGARSSQPAIPGGSLSSSRALAQGEESLARENEDADILASACFHHRGVVRHDVYVSCLPAPGVDALAVVEQLAAALESPSAAPSGRAPLTVQRVQTCLGDGERSLHPAARIGRLVSPLPE